MQDGYNDVYAIGHDNYDMLTNGYDPVYADQTAYVQPASIHRASSVERASYVERGYVPASTFRSTELLSGSQEAAYGSTRQLYGSSGQQYRSAENVHGSSGNMQYESHPPISYVPAEVPPGRGRQKRVILSKPSQQYRKPKFPTGPKSPQPKPYPTQPFPKSPTQANSPRYRTSLSPRARYMLVIGSVLLLVVALAGGMFGVYAKLSNNTNSESLQIIGEVTIRNLKWSDALLNPSSPEFVTYKSQFCTEMKNIMTTTTDTVDECQILSFREGSVVVEYQLDMSMRRNTGSSPSDLYAQASSRITNGLIASTNYRIEGKDIEFKDGDQCANDPCPAGTDCFDLKFNYSCGCNKGYDYIERSQECRDIDECERSSPCDHTCTNTIGSFLCSCDVGYTLGADGRLCDDYGECTDVKFNHGCEHTCVDEIPSYRCACNVGFGLLADGKTCKDFNECASDNHGCEHTCTNTPGSYMCSCNDGFYLWTDGRTCKPHFASLTLEPIGVDHVRVLTGSTTVLGCSIPTKDPEAIKHIRWTGPNGDVKVIDKLSNDVDISMASKYDSLHKASLLGFINQYGGPSDVVAGQYTCNFTVGDFHRELVITVEISDCSYDAGYAMCEDRKHCVLRSELCDGTPHCPSTSDDEILHCATPPTNTPFCPASEYLCGDKCLQQDDLCDGNTHCEDAIDEYACDERCSGYSCDDGGCISINLKCDGEMHCKDGSDEKNCGACALSDHHLCGNGVCLAKSTDEIYCNKISDCPDRSDEPAQCECLSSQHFCDDTCKPGSIRCDKQADCMDGSDEKNCNCEVGEFQCDNGRCIEDRLRQNGQNDCGDGSDEVASAACSASEFQCSDMRCIPQLRVRDKVNDCGDWSDEITDDCPDGLMHCANGACLWRDAALYHCDGQQQCPDASDEQQGCECLSGEQHDCGDHCIPLQWVDDGEYDCIDKSDEQIADFPCSESTHRCSSDGKCIPKSWLCDGHADCEDGSDETCGETSGDNECTSNEFRCPASGLCIRTRETCDGTNHCGDFADELLDRCPVCTDAQFACDNGACIPKAQKCDGHRHCLGGEDEDFCSCDKLQCSDGRCIPEEWRCDRVDDCDNGSDEQNCGTCRSNQFQCHNYDCIPAVKQCDGVRHCSDGSDEFNCAQRTSLLGIVILTSQSVESPVCSYRWQTRWGNDICSMIGMGYMTSSSTTALADHPQGYLTANDMVSSHLDLADFTHSSRCPTGSVVTVHCESLSCGAQSPRLGFQAAPYVINGQSASEGEWPWQVGIQFNGKFKCGGVLINEEWVITAAHCLGKDPYNDDKYTVKMGSLMRSGRSAGSNTQVASKLVTHPRYIASTIQYDIAMVKLSTPVLYSDHIRPACLHDKDIDLTSFRECYGTGWGVNNDDKNPEQLHEAKMTILSAARCNALEVISTVVDDNIMICAGYTDGFIATCAGDSGGPLACRDHHGLWSVVGLTSWGNTGCTTFTVFTRVAVFKDWITKTIAQDKNRR